VWLGTQFQAIDQQAAAEVAGLKPEQVTVHTTFLGGGFGRRATGSAHVVREAVATAKASGMPVKVVWTREDDIHGGYYRPQWLHRVAIHAGPDGLPHRWDHTIVGQSIIKSTPFEQALAKDGVDLTSVEGVADSPYVKRAPVHRVELHSPDLPVTTLWWRSVGHSHNAFVMESLVDELAHAAKQDPLEYRRRLLAEHPRHLGVLNLAADKAGWGNPLPKGHARGLAVHESFGSWVAQVAEVSLDGDQVRVHRVVCAVDCGICVNPEGVRAQMESGIVYGLSAALFGRITLKEGRVQQSNFHDYRVVRLNEAPAIEVHIIPSSEKPGGAGEPGTPPIAPAVGNAVFRLTNRRLRSLPFDLSGAI
jgi:isoquinoline 1-oxidoreductase beta subunit